MIGTYSFSFPIAPFKLAMHVLVDIFHHDLDVSAGLISALYHRVSRPRAKHMKIIHILTTEQTVVGGDLWTGGQVGLVAT